MVVQELQRYVRRFYRAVLPGDSTGRFCWTILMKQICRSICRALSCQGMIKSMTKGVIMGGATRISVRKRDQWQRMMHSGSWTG